MSNKKQVLIIDEMHESIVPMLEGIGFEVRYDPHISREEIIGSIGDYDGLMVRSKTAINNEVIDAGSRLKFVARAGAGIDQLDVGYLEEKGIAILNAPEGNRDAVGEHTLGLLLGLLNRINVSDREIKSGVWKREENRGLELKNRVVGIYGFGNTGSSFAKKLSGFDCKVIAYDKYKKGYNSYTEEVTEEEFRKRVEILSLHIPLTDETRLLFDEEELSRYPSLKLILNTARGEIMKLADALKLLEAGKLIGLGLDVLENEKIDKLNDSEQEVFNRLVSRSDVILTPHVAGWTHESYERINTVLVDKIKGLNLA